MTRGSRSQPWGTHCSQRSDLSRCMGCQVRSGSHRDQSHKQRRLESDTQMKRRTHHRTTNFFMAGPSPSMFVLSTSSFCCFLFGSLGLAYVLCTLCLHICNSIGRRWRRSARTGGGISRPGIREWTVSGSVHELVACCGTKWVQAAMHAIGVAALEGPGVRTSGGCAPLCSSFFSVPGHGGNGAIAPFFSRGRPGESGAAQRLHLSPEHTCNGSNKNKRTLTPDM